jgi:hypothetical protein
MTSIIHVRKEYRFQNETHVKFDNGNIKGTGRIKGIATNELPVIGVTWIIEIETLSTFEGTPIIYHYSCLAIPDIHVTKYEY